MKLSGHAKFKLEIYNIAGEEIIRTSSKPIYEFYDADEETHIKIIELNEILFALVCNKQTNIIITVYRTDQRTINNRQKSKRWI
mgnify:CR=1 FL=1